MRNSRVLIVNAGALANEIIKNIVLAGIGSLTVLDSHVVTASDLGAQFFINDDCIGKNVGGNCLLFIVYCFFFIIS